MATNSIFTDSAFDPLLIYFQTQHIDTHSRTVIINATEYQIHFEAKDIWFELRIAFDTSHIDISGLDWKHRID